MKPEFDLNFCLCWASHSHATEFNHYYPKWSYLTIIAHRIAERHPEYLNDTYVANNMAHIHIYFKQLHFMQQERKERFTGLEVMANIGGLLGLCMGISFLSAIEVIYFFVLRGIRVLFKC